jgi:phosphate transport system substrate-binding protein
MKIGYRSVPILAGILLTLVLSASLAAVEENAIRVYGATTFAELIQDLGKEFMKKNPDVQMKVVGKTSEFGFEALLNKQADFVMATRKPNIVEKRLAERKRVEWKGVRIGWENVAVICHPDVSMSELTVDQLRKIYTGEYKNWRDLRGADLPILPHSLPYPQDDVAVWFAENILSIAEFASGIIWVKTPDFLVQHISVHPGAVAYLGNIQFASVMKRQTQSKVKVLSVRAVPESQAFSPSIDISKKKDYPLVIPLFLFWNANETNDRIEQFAQFCKESIGESERPKLSE